MVSLKAGAGHVLHANQPTLSVCLPACLPACLQVRGKYAVGGVNLLLRGVGVFRDHAAVELCVACTVADVVCALFCCQSRPYLLHHLGLNAATCW